MSSNTALAQREEMEVAVDTMFAELTQIDSARQANKLAIMRSMTTGDTPALVAVAEGRALRLAAQIKNTKSEILALNKVIEAQASASTQAAWPPLVAKYVDLATNLSVVYATLHAMARSNPLEQAFRQSSFSIPTGSHAEFRALKDLNVKKLIREQEQELTKRRQNVIATKMGENKVMALLFKPMAVDGRIPFSIDTGPTVDPHGNHGLKLNTDGAIFASNSTLEAWGKSGLLFDSDGRLLVSISGEIDHADQGANFTATGALIITAGPAVRVQQGVAFGADGGICYSA